MVGDRTLSFTGAEKAEDEHRNRIFGEEDIPRSLTAWAEFDTELRSNMLTILDAVNRDENGWLDSYDCLKEERSISKTTISRYINDGEKLERCLTKRDSAYELTKIGRSALGTNWVRVADVV